MERDPYIAGMAAAIPMTADELLHLNLPNKRTELVRGVLLVWVVDPIRRVARVYRRDGTESQLTEHDALDGEDVLPGLSIPLADVL